MNKKYIKENIIIMKYADIPKFPHPNYTVNIEFEYIEEWLAEHNKDIIKLDLDPEFQRGYVWTEEQKVQYMEYVLKGGFSGRDIYFNCPTWHNLTSAKGFNVLTIIDGKQRLNAVLSFLHNEIKVYGEYYKDWISFGQIYGDKRTDKLGHDANFIVHIHNIPNEIEVVKWYLGMNTGGSIHTKQDINIAKEYLNKLMKK